MGDQGTPIVLSQTGLRQAAALIFFAEGSLVFSLENAEPSTFRSSILNTVNAPLRRQGTVSPHFVFPESYSFNLQIRREYYSMGSIISGEHYFGSSTISGEC